MSNHDQPTITPECLIQLFGQSNFLLDEKIHQQKQNTQEENNNSINQKNLTVKYTFKQIESLTQNTILKFTINNEEIYYLHKCTVTNSLPGCYSDYVNLVGLLSSTLQDIYDEKNKTIDDDGFLSYECDITIHDIGTDYETISIYDDIDEEPFSMIILEQGNDNVVTLVEFKVKDIPEVIRNNCTAYHNYNGQGIYDNCLNYIEGLYEKCDKEEIVRPFPGDHAWITLSDYNKYLLHNE